MGLQSWDRRAEGQATPSFFSSLLGRAVLFEERNRRYVADGHVTVVRTDAGLEARFLRYLLATEMYQGYMSAVLAQGATNQIELSREGLRSMPIPIPPQTEQRAIATILDRKTAAIDALIARRELSIELLQEKARATISQVVTRGLDADVPMKASGSRWPGMVPKHWALRALKWNTRVKRGASPRPIDDPRYFHEEGTHGWVRIEDVTAGSMYLRRTAQRLSPLGVSLSVRLAPGDLFLSIAGSVGKPCVAGIDCCIHDGFVYFPDWRGDVRFLYYVFASAEPFRGLGKLGTQLNLNTDTVGSVVLGIPGLTEQALIADYLDKTMASLETCVERILRQLEVLHEYRQTLITAAVTGKIDVSSMEAA